MILPIFYGAASMPLDKNIIARVPMKQSWRIWIKLDSTKPQKNMYRLYIIFDDVMTSFHGCTSFVTEISTQWASCAELRCFLLCWHDQTFEQPLSAICNAVILMCLHSNSRYVVANTTHVPSRDVMLSDDIMIITHQHNSSTHSLWLVRVKYMFLWCGLQFYILIIVRWIRRTEKQ